MSKPVPPVDVWLDSNTRVTFHTVFCSDGVKRMVVSRGRDSAYSLQLVFTPNARNASAAIVSVLGERGWWRLDELPLGQIFRVTAALLYRRPLLIDEATRTEETADNELG